MLRDVRPAAGCCGWKRWRARVGGVSGLTAIPRGAGRFAAGSAPGGCDCGVRRSGIFRASFAGIAGAPGSCFRPLPKRNCAGGHHDWRRGGRSQLQRRRGGTRLSGTSRNSGTRFDRGDAGLRYGAIGGARSRNHARQWAAQLRSGERRLSRVPDQEAIGA